LEPVSTLTLTNHSIALELLFFHNQFLLFFYHKFHRLKKEPSSDAGVEIHPVNSFTSSLLFQYRKQCSPYALALMWVMAKEVINIAVILDVGATNYGIVKKRDKGFDFTEFWGGNFHL